MYAMRIMNTSISEMNFNESKESEKKKKWMNARTVVAVITIVVKWNCKKLLIFSLVFLKDFEKTRRRKSRQSERDAEKFPKYIFSSFIFFSDAKWNVEDPQESKQK